MKRNRYPALLLLAILTSPAYAIDRLTVEVVCQLAEERYRLALTTANIADIETDCGKQLAGQLGEKFGFLLFASGETHDDQLIIRMGKSAQEVAPSEFRPVNVEMWVQGSNVSGRGDAVTWTFRTLTDFLRVPTADTFADDIALRFADEFEKIEADFVRAQLANLAIANTAFPMPQDGSWLLPFTRTELGIGDNSVFRIKATLKVASGTEEFDYEVELFGRFETATDVPLIFHHKAKALHKRDRLLSREESLERLSKAEKVTVLQVAVSRYVPMSTLGHTSPSGLDLNEGGQ